MAKTKVTAGRKVEIRPVPLTGHPTAIRLVRSVRSVSVWRMAIVHRIQFRGTDEVNAGRPQRCEGVCEVSPAVS